MYLFYPLLLCGITLSTTSLSTDLKLFDNNVPLSLDLTTVDDFGSSVLLGDDTSSTFNLVQGDSHELMI